MIVVLAIMVYVTCVVAALIHFQGLRALVRLVNPTLRDHCVAIWSQRLAETIIQGGDAIHALRAAQGISRWPYPWRLRRCIALLDGESPPTLVTALARCKLLPKASIPLGLAAENDGPQALARFFQRLTAIPRSAGNFSTWLGPWLGLGLIFAGLLTFLHIAILPKFQAIAKDLGIPFNPWMGAIFTGSDFFGRNWWWLLIVALVLGSAVATAMVSLRWWVRRRSHLGHLILEGLAQGRSEGDLGELVAQSRPASADRARRAGGEGDLKSLLHCAGFTANNATTVATCLARRERWHQARIDLLLLSLRVLMPIMAGVVVGVLSYGLHHMLIDVLYAIAQDQP